MTKLQSQLATPASLLIEQTALKLATTFYEAGRSSGMTSKYKDARSYARAYVERFIPKAVELLMDILGNPNTPQEQKNLIYDAMMERTNDPELKTRIKAFENDTPFIPDWKAPSNSDLALDKAIKDMDYGQKGKAN